jgi:hypothetical protein
MLREFFKDLFGQKSVADNRVYTRFDARVLQQYRQQYPNLKMHEIRIPKIGNKESYMIKHWFKNEGDSIEAKEIICEIESNDIKLELECYESGTIYFKTPSNKQLQVGDLICVIINRP